jgi:hypothetical protein
VVEELQASCHQRFVGASLLSKLMQIEFIFLGFSVVGVPGEKNDDGNHAEEQAKKEPKPCTAARILSPQGAEGSEEEKDRAASSCVFHVLIQLVETSIDLTDFVSGLLVRIGDCNGHQRQPGDHHEENDSKHVHLIFLCPNV